MKDLVEIGDRLIALPGRRNSHHNPPLQVVAIFKAHAYLVHDWLLERLTPEDVASLAALKKRAKPVALGLKRSAVVGDQVWEDCQGLLERWNAATRALGASGFPIYGAPQRLPPSQLLVATETAEALFEALKSR